MSQSRDLIGRTIKTDIGNLIIKKCSYAGILTGKDGKITKCVKVKTKCGAEFSAPIDAVKNTVLN